MSQVIQRSTSCSSLSFVLNAQRLRTVRRRTQVTERSRVSQPAYTRAAPLAGYLYSCHCRQAATTVTLNDELVLGCGRDEWQRWRLVLIVNALGLDFERCPPGAPYGMGCGAPCDAPGPEGSLGVCGCRGLSVSWSIWFLTEERSAIEDAFVTRPTLIWNGSL